MPLNESDDVDDVEDEDEDDEDVALLEAIRLSQMESMSDLDIRMREEEELKQVHFFDLNDKILKMILLSLLRIFINLKNTLLAQDEMPYL